MTWRPDGWETPWYRIDDYGPNSMAQEYERGVDAILKALKSEGISCKAASNAFWHLDGTNAAWSLADRFDGKRGTLVFIPDDAAPQE